MESNHCAITLFVNYPHIRAKDGERFRNPHFGRVVLYRLSYFRKPRLSECQSLLWIPLICFMFRGGLCIKCCLQFISQCSVDLRELTPLVTSIALLVSRQGHTLIFSKRLYGKAEGARFELAILFQVCTLSRGVP